MFSEFYRLFYLQGHSSKISNIAQCLYYIIKPERFKSSIYLEKFKRIEKNERFKRIEKNEMQGQKEMKGKVSTPTE